MTQSPIFITAKWRSVLDREEKHVNTYIIYTHTHKHKATRTREIVFGIVDETVEASIV